MVMFLVLHTHTQIDTYSLYSAYIVYIIYIFFIFLCVYTAIFLVLLMFLLFQYLLCCCNTATFPVVGLKKQISLTYDNIYIVFNHLTKHVFS